MILGAGGVVPSIIFGLQNLQIGKIYVSNRTLKKAEALKEKYNYVEIIDWGKIQDCDLIINCTSIGLKKNDKIEIDFKKLSGKKIFYDLIYNPPITTLLSEAINNGHIIVNGKDMFLYQAQKAFSLWHNVNPKLEEKLTEFLYND